MSPEVQAHQLLQAHTAGGALITQPHLPGVREFLQLQLQLPRGGYSLALPHLERLKLLLEPGYIVLIWQ